MWAKYKEMNNDGPYWISGDLVWGHIWAKLPEKYLLDIKVDMCNRDLDIGICKSGEGSLGKK